MTSYTSDIEFLSSTFNKCRIRLNFLNPNTPLGKEMCSLNAFIDEGYREKRSFFDIYGEIKENCVYKVVDRSKVNYMFMLIKEQQDKSLILIGPFLSAPIQPENILEIAEEYSIPPNRNADVKRFYESLPILKPNSHLFIMLDTFCERRWGKNYNFIDLNDSAYENFTPFSKQNSSATHDSIISMQLMEERYAYENELMAAVAAGQTHKAELFFSNFSHDSFEKRLADPIRNIKNYCIITNTLLRKAAENGGVHPLYLNDISSSFAAKIELLPSIPNAKSLMIEMFRSYCNLVKRNSIKHYCAPVQKAIAYIDANLSTNVSLRTLATEQNISPGYLSALFKKETGKNITEFINEKRIDHAKQLLVNTKLQIQTVASHCGILDVHYFSKLFKKHTGKTPKEYRKNTT